ncbi:hypothetical protein ACFQY7_44160 [Actinomadura luteofluorescens]|uniref:hypothetical protein n=1 Tax=Actinomadura luteofluorescens TaxID=46163 RepID=UPI00362BE3CD
MTGAGVNSTLLRARSRLERLVPASDEIVEPDEPGRRELLDRFARAFETVDIPALTRLLTEEAAWEMPPVPHWFAGREAIGSSSPPGCRSAATPTCSCPSGRTASPPSARTCAARTAFCARIPSWSSPPLVPESRIFRALWTHPFSMASAFPASGTDRVRSARRTPLLRGAAGG